jgi:thymidylate synthase ThyX
MSKIIIHTCVNAEDNAMLQALYSRSIDSVTDHIQKLEEVGSSKFMSQYYLGYGHASIGDCGTETMYFEGISMLAAKAIEDNPLFVGQECSSRYIDFSYQAFYDPMEKNSEDSGKVGNLYSEYRKFYVESLEPLKEDLRKRFPIKEGDKPNVYEKAIAARAFDILRGFLPAGATTNVAWSGRLSNAGEHLIWMMHHPLWEVKRLGAEGYRQMQAKYPNSFRLDYAIVANSDIPESFEHELRNIEGDEVFEFNSDFNNFYAQYQEVCGYEKIAKYYEIQTLVGTLEDEDCRSLLPAFKDRPKRTKLHKHSLVSQSTVWIETRIDFGSFRDIQRHRNGYCGMPLVTGEYGLHPWYYENLTSELQKKADELLEKVKDTYDRLDLCETDNDFLAFGQYILPMGNIVQVAMKYTIQQAMYVAELRSGKTVHATARPFAKTIGAYLEKYGIPVYYDKDVDDWTVRRGEQDIVKK